MISGKEKIYFLLGCIQDLRATSLSAPPLKIDRMNDLYGKYEKEELSRILAKLEQDDHILKVLKIPSEIKTIDFVEGLDPYEEPPEQDDGLWHIELIQPAFDEYLLRTQEEPEYKEFSHKKLLTTQTKTRSEESQFALRPTIYFGGNILPTKSSSAKRIASEFSEQNRAFVIRVLKDIVSSVDFSDDGKVPYQLKSPAGIDIINERKLLRKLASFGLFRNLGEDDIFGIATLTDLNVELINDVILSLDALDTGLYSREEFRGAEETEKVEKGDKLSIKSPLWQDDFRWEGKKFIFGNHGSTSGFNSKERRLLFKELTDAKGAWVSVKKLRQITEKGDDYVRPTIGQIERSFSKSLRNFISIPSTEGDNLQPKPQEGAYRIKFTPKPL